MIASQQMEIDGSRMDRWMGDGGWIDGRRGSVKMATPATPSTSSAAATAADAEKISLAPGQSR